MKPLFHLAAGALAALMLPVFSARAETLIWGVDIEQFEYRLGESGDDVLAWDFDALIGSDELKFVWRSEAEYEEPGRRFETLENQARVQFPISSFFDAVAGVRYEAPKNADRVSGVLGVHGLTKQWFEIDADLFLSDEPAARFEVEYEGLVTNFITLTPSLEIDLPFTDSEEFEVGAWGPKVELGARLSYDLVDRVFSPYFGIHYEQVFGETKRLAEAEGKGDSAVFAVLGFKMLF
jgi:copper resistance protein B